MPGRISCMKSLSPVRMVTSISWVTALRARVPIRSSASYPLSSRMGMRIAAASSRMRGSCEAMSSGIFSRVALYSACISWRKVGALVSETMAR